MTPTPRELRRATEGLHARAALLAEGGAGVPVPIRAWLATTVLREHRGDVHVASLAEAGLDGCEPHLSLAGSGHVPGEVLRGARGRTPR